MKKSTSRHLEVLIAAVMVGLALWGAFRLVGVELDLKEAAASDRVRAIDVFVSTTLAGLAVWAIHSYLVRHHRERLWPFLGSTALAISIIGPTWLADGEAAVALIVMHLAVGATIIGGFASFAGPVQIRPEARSAGNLQVRSVRPGH